MLSHGPTAFLRFSADAASSIGHKLSTATAVAVAIRRWAQTVPKRIERKVTGVPKTINLLYLNGWALDKRATFRRGLLDALKIFAEVAKEFDNVTLTVRSQLPELDEEYQEILNDKRVTVLEDKVSLSKLHGLFKTSDILLYPAVRIAVTTLQQAMANSLAIVASDGFGIEEYVEHGVNRLIGKGFHGKAGYIDNDGFFRENYIYSLKSNPEVVENCVQHVRRLITDEEYRAWLQNNARKTLEERYSMDKWNEQFGSLLDRILKKS